MGVSKNSGTPKWMVYNGKPYWKWMIWGYQYFRKHPNGHDLILILLYHGDESVKKKRVGGLNHPIWTICAFVKMDHFPECFWADNFKKRLKFHHLEHGWLKKKHFKWEMHLQSSGVSIWISKNQHHPTQNLFFRPKNHPLLGMFFSRLTGSNLKKGGRSSSRKGGKRIPSKVRKSTLW